MLKNIFIGIKAYAGAFELISKLKLWNYFIIPILISVVTAIAISVSAYGFSDNIGEFISQIWVWEWGKETFKTISEVFGGLLVLVLGLVLYKHIVMALSAPFMSPVSEKIEAHLLGENSNLIHQHRNTSFQSQLWRGIRINVRNLAMELWLTIIILIMSLIPVIGWFTSLLLFFIQAYYAGFGNMDYTLERHFKYRDSISFVRKNRGIAIGNGIVFMLFLLIPVIGVILVLPLSVTAASTETVKLLKANHER
ncbi:EI24 domain-containing protein [Pontimicrobium aquaticum]|uniref:EI24 domain-containing protein n=1 Tax=Pontimicrobium aquaticum TaxID=2565367 RepID=A0A4U0ESE4_9FLAO|nr:EI24 domain-containing protein [Pontimicrobium aquaticum]TJY34706.1 EI24 domain-containing protein [Pontimicrobium aquaticum]